MRGADPGRSSLPAGHAREGEVKGPAASHRPGRKARGGRASRNRAPAPSLPGPPPPPRVKGAAREIGADGATVEVVRDAVPARGALSRRGPQAEEAGPETEEAGPEAGA